MMLLLQPGNLITFAAAYFQKDTYTLRRLFSSDSSSKIRSSDGQNGALEDQV